MAKVRKDGKLHNVSTGVKVPNGLILESKGTNRLRDNLSQYAENKALVFEGIEFLHVWINLMRKRYENLASHLVNIDGMFKSKEEAIQIMKARTTRFT